jgi:(S)-ureidoglycine aminohydrolase
MPELFGHTRARVGARHALITADNRVASNVPGVSGAEAVILVSPAMGAGFAQLLLTFGRGGSASGSPDQAQTFGYVMSGAATVAIGGRKSRCAAGGYFFAPAGQSWSLGSPLTGTQVTLFQKKYVPLPGTAAPRPIVGSASRIKGEPFLGDPAANLQVLLPDDPSFDFAVNRFSYVPGGHLPYVEVHVMEHGLIMLEGQGVYRLEDQWYPVRAGDAIWMAPYCPQWFVAMGKKPASYLYYKDVNRSAL